VRASVARTAARTRGVMFFVNLHADELLDEALYDAASPLSALAPEVALEITERSPIDAVPDLRVRRQRLREMGFRLAVDDLGSGYAGLTAYASLEPDFVKLDRGLVVGIDHEPVKSRLVASIVSASRDMGIAVVAEGIEADSERRAMAELGCELMQGYLFRRPEALKEEEFFSVGALPAAAAPEGGRKE
jgi:EAL domain-containing protein (putative c-di-GMP-specific phosphodiesterase class I)